MASFLFQNIKTGATKVVNSKDSKQAHKSYENGTWKYVKSVPQQKSYKKAKSVKSKSQLWLLSCELVSEVQRLKSQAQDYDCRFAEYSAMSMEGTLCKLQRLLSEM